MTSTAHGLDHRTGQSLVAAGGFAARFRELRKRAGLTASALASGRYSESYISRIEAGLRRPSPQAMAFFADRLGVSERFLATGIRGDVDVAFRYRLVEARRDLAEGRPKVAETKVRALLSQADEPPLAGLRAPALAALGEILRLQGRLSEAVDALEEAREGTLSRYEASLVAAGLAETFAAAGDLGAALDAVESFFQRDGALIGQPLAAGLALIAVSAYVEMGKTLDAQRIARRVLEAETDDAAPAHRAEAYWQAAARLASTERWEDALEVATWAGVLSEEMRSVQARIRLHVALASIALDSDPVRVEEARVHLDAAESLLTGVDGSADLRFALLEQSRLALFDGLPELALTHAERVLSEPTQDRVTPMAQLVKGKALAKLGRSKDAIKVLRQAAVSFRARGEPQREAESWSETGELYLAGGQAGAAAEAFRKALSAIHAVRSRA